MLVCCSRNIYHHQCQKTVVLLNIFVDICFQDSLMIRYEQHLFEMEIFGNIIHVAVTFDLCNASLLKPCTFTRAAPLKELKGAT